MEIKPFDGNKERWDRFVEENSGGVFFHRIGWKNVIEKTFNYKPFYFYTEEEGKITGILPMFLVKSLFFGKSLVSTPFGVYGGVLASGGEFKNLLLENARKIAMGEGVSYIELKSITKEFDQLPVKDLYVTFFQELHDDPDVNFNLIPRKTRRMIRVSMNNGLEAEISRDLNDFFDIYASSLKNLGTPVFPKRFFAEILKEFPKESFILYVKHQARRVAAVLTFSYKDSLLPYYGGSYRSFNKLGVNNFMYWKLIEYGCKNGFRTFDFGRSKTVDSGSYDFKRHWGMQEVNLKYQYYLLKGAELPNASPANPKVKWLVNAWKRLPLALTKLIGPRLVRYFP